MNAGLTGRGQRPALHAAEANDIGAAGDRLDDVAATAEAAIDHDPRAALHRIGDLGQHMHGAPTVIELASAVIGDIDPLDPVIERDRCVLRGGDALDDEWYLVLVLDQFHGSPLQPLLEVAAGGAQAAGADIALGDVALAPAVMGGINGEAEGGIVVGNRAADAVLDKRVIAADIELKDAQRVGGRFSDLLEARLGD